MGKRVSVYQYDLGLIRSEGKFEGICNALVIPDSGVYDNKTKMIHHVFTSLRRTGAIIILWTARKWFVGSLPTFEEQGQ